MNEKGLRSIALTAYESQKAYIADVKENKLPGFSLLYIVRLILAFYPFLFPITFMIKYISGCLSWNARRSTIDLIVIAKIAIITLIFIAPFHTDNMHIIMYIQPFFCRISHNRNCSL